MRSSGCITVAICTSGSRVRPTQHITTNGRSFTAANSASALRFLIPRPETELLVETVLRLRPAAGLVVDAGTGSGAIAVTLALESQAHLIATDFCVRASQVATENARCLGAKVDFLQADWLSSLAAGSVDVVVSNPPYVAEEDRATLQPEVRDWEPALALFAGSNGMSVYERLIPEAWRVLRPGGLLALELGFGQAEAVSALAQEWRGIKVLPDLAGISRVLVCEKV